MKISALQSVHFPIFAPLSETRARQAGTTRLPSRNQLKTQYKWKNRGRRYSRQASTISALNPQHFPLERICLMFFAKCVFVCAPKFVSSRVAESEEPNHDHQPVGRAGTYQRSDSSEALLISRKSVSQGWLLGARLSLKAPPPSCLCYAFSQNGKHTPTHTHLSQVAELRISLSSLAL